MIDGAGRVAGGFLDGFAYVDDDAGFGLDRGAIYEPWEEAQAMGNDGWSDIVGNFAPDRLLFASWINQRLGPGKRCEASRWSLRRGALNRALRSDLPDIRHRATRPK